MRRVVVSLDPAGGEAAVAEARRLRDLGAEVVVTGAQGAEALAATAVSEDAAEVVVPPSIVEELRRALADLDAADIDVRALMH